MGNRTRKKQKLIHLILNIVIVGLCLTMVCCVVATISKLDYDYIPSGDITYLQYCIDDDAEYQMIMEYYLLQAYDVKLNREQKECYGVAKYFEAASYYRAFMETGDMERAEREKKKMEQAIEEMGNWNVVKEDIDTKLGL